MSYTVQTRRIRHHITEEVLALGAHSVGIWLQRNPHARLVFTRTPGRFADFYFNPDHKPEPVLTLADYIRPRLEHDTSL